MIEYRISKDAHRYFIWNGRHLCSSRNPEAEAVKWLDSQSQDLESVSQLVVLGLGTAYHVAELQKRYPQKSICVVETQPEFVCPALSLHDSSFRAEVLVTETVDIFKAQSRIRTILKSPFHVLKYNPVCSHQSELYSKIHELLTGRTVEALKFQIQRRSPLQKQFELEQMSAPAKQRLLSVKDLDDALLPDASHEEFHLIRALRELVV